MSHTKYVVAVVLLAIVAFVPTVKEVFAQVVCPVGYICTPTTPAPQPTSTNQQSIVARAGAGTLALTYDSNNAEAYLKATFTVSITAVDRDLYVYKNSAGYSFIDQNGVRAQANSQLNLELYPTTSGVRDVTDQYGQTLYVVRAGETALFQAAGGVLAKQLFAGTYYASMTGLYVNSGTDQTKAWNFTLGNNRSNTKTIVGEVSPYISSVTSPIKVGEMMIVRGQRLTGDVFIDGVLVSGGMKGDATNIGFALPSNLSNGYHIIVVKNEKGESNRVSFLLGDTNQPIPTDNGETVIFGEKFTISDTSAPVTLAIAADNGYSIAVNGRAIATSKGDYNFSTINYHDLTPYLSSQGNVLEVKVFNNYLTGAYETGLGNPAGLAYKVVKGRCNTFICISTSTTIIATDGNEVHNGKGAGMSVVLSKNDPAWVTIPGAKWVWSRDFYQGTPTIPTPVPSSQVNISISAVSPVARTVAVSATSETDNVVLGVFDIKSAGQDGILRSLNLDLRVAGAAPILSAVKLNVAGITYSASSMSMADATFRDMVVRLPANQTVSITVLGRVPKNTNNYLNGSRVAPAIRSTGVVVENASYAQIPVASANVIAQPTTFSNASAAILSNEYAALGTPVESNNMVVAIPVSFTYTLTAGNDTIYVSTNAAQALSTSGSGFNPLPSITAVTATPSEVAGDRAGMYFVVPAGGSRTFKWLGTIKAVEASTPGVTYRMFRVDKVYYGMNPSNISESGSLTPGLRVDVVIGQQSVVPTTPPQVTGMVKCIFNGSTKEEFCSSTENGYYFKGVGSAGGSVTGIKGNQITWKSSCGGYAYTVNDGGNAYANFTCQSSTIPAGTNNTVQGAPTATFTINGKSAWTYKVGETNNYEWSSTNADKFSSSYTSRGGDICGSGPWIANNAKGSSQTYLGKAYAGCIWTVTYTATNSQTGQSASAVVEVRVVSDSVNGSTTVPAGTNNSSAAWNAIKGIFFR